jgi:hypothetical protein
MPLTPTSTNDGIVLTDLSLAIALSSRGMAMPRRQPMNQWDCTLHFWVKSLNRYGLPRLMLTRSLLRVG